MSKIRVRPLEPSDHEQLYILHKTRDGGDVEGVAERRTGLVEWFAFHNPFSKEEATYYVAEDAGVLVALEGRMPLEFSFRGRKVKGYYVHDTYVHPAYREKGVGFSLILSLAETIEKESDSFFCVLGGTPLNLSIQRRMGYHEAPAAPKYLKILALNKDAAEALRIPKFAGPLIPLISGVVAMLDRILMAWNRSSLRTFSLDRFDSRCDDLMNSVGAGLGICSYKSSGYLNWKYVDGPARAPAILAVEKERRMTGFVVLASTWRRKMKEGVVMEFLANPSDTETIAALCKAMVEYFREANAQSISCVLSDRRFSAVLKKFLFLEVGSGMAVLLGNLDRLDPELSFLTDSERWHLTLGESDAFMLPLKFI